MAGAIFTNFASATILTPIVNVGDTVIGLSAGLGAQFPAPAAGQYFYGVIVDSLTAPTKREVIKVISRVGDSLAVVVRGQDGTVAQAWVAGNFVELRLVNANFAEFANVNNNLSDLPNAATARGNLGLGSMAIQNAGAVGITGGTVTGVAIDNSVIGGLTPVQGTFNDLRATRSANTTIGVTILNNNAGAAAQAVTAYSNGTAASLSMGLGGSAAAHSGLFAASASFIYSFNSPIAFIADGTGRMDFAVGGFVPGNTQLSLTPAGPTFPNIIPTALAGLYKIPVVLFQLAVPAATAPTGSIAANGAITLGTGLPTTYPNIYLCFPANALFAGSGAFFYYCQMTSPTVGVAFNNVMGVGSIYDIPAVPTPIVAAGPGAFVGINAEVQGPSLLIPPNIMGKHGKLSISHLWSFANASGTPQTPRLRWGASGIGGANVLMAPVISTTIKNVNAITQLANRGVTNVQVSPNTNNPGFGTQVGGTAGYWAEDTTTPRWITFTLNPANSIDTTVLEDFTITLIQTP